MTSRKQNKLGPYVPTWFGVSRMLSDCEVVIRCEDSSFQFSNQTVVLGQYGLLLVAPLVLREESRVQMRVTSDGRRVEVGAVVESARRELGTIFRLLPAEDRVHLELEALLAEESASKQ